MKVSSRFLPFRAAGLSIVLGGVLLASIAVAQPTNSVVAFGLTIQAKEGSVVSLDENGFPVAAAAPDEDWRFGVRIWLGEADHGLFGYPGADWENEEFVMRGTAYGSVDGVTNERIASVAGVRDSWGIYTVTADLGALGAASYTVMVCRGGSLVQVGSDWEDESVSVVIDYYYAWPSGLPRVNPYWRMPDGSIGTLIELDRVAILRFDAGDSEAYGNRVFLRANNPSRRVDFVSHVDVTAPTALPGFNLTDARVGAFGHVHKALGGATLSVLTNRLRLGNLGDGNVGEIMGGVAVELDEPHAFAGPWLCAPADGAGRFEADIEPLTLSSNGAWLRLEAIGTFRATDTNYGDSVGSVWGSLDLVNRQGVLELTPELSWMLTNALVAIYDRGSLVGAASISSSNRVLQLSGSPSVIGCAVFANSPNTPAGYAIGFNGPATFSNTNGVSLTGDEVRLLAVQGTVPLAIASVQTFALTAANIPSFTVIAERRRPVDSPPMSIARAERNVTLSWPDPNRLFRVESGPAVTDMFEETGDETIWANDGGVVTLTTTNQANSFFRLRSIEPYSLPD